MKIYQGQGGQGGGAGIRGHRAGVKGAGDGGRGAGDGENGAGVGRFLVERGLYKNLLYFTDFTLVLCTSMQ